MGLAGTAKLSFALDPRRDAPLYAQLQEQLRAHIASGRLRPDEPIPSEREIQRLTGLSRMTVRQAISGLAYEGLLRRDHGRGTFVSRRVLQDLNGVYSFTARVREQGREPTTRLLAAETVPASEEQAAILAGRPGEPLIRLRRLRLVDGAPTMVDVVHIPQRLCPELLREDLTGSLYALLSERFGLPPLCSTDTLDAVAATPELAASLEVPPGAPLILMRRLALTHGGTPMELTEEYVRPDRGRYRIALVADPPVIELKAAPAAFGGG